MFESRCHLEEFVLHRNRGVVEVILYTSYFFRRGREERSFLALEIQHFYQTQNFSALHLHG